MATQSIEARLEGLQIRRMKQEDRFYDKLVALTEKAEALIGQLCREGKTIFYINLQDRNGNLTGRTKEGSSIELTEYLIRNHYVSVR